MACDPRVIVTDPTVVFTNAANQNWVWHWITAWVLTNNYTQYRVVLDYIVASAAVDVEYGYEATNNRVTLAGPQYSGDVVATVQPFYGTWKSLTTGVNVASYQELRVGVRARNPVGVTGCNCARVQLRIEFQ